MPSQGSETRDQSEFNMAVSYLNRLNTLFYACDYASIELDGYLWFHCLLALFRELSTEMKEDEISNLMDSITNMNQHIIQMMEVKSETGRNEIPPNLYIMLNNFELKIRRILKESGLQTKMKDDWMFLQPW